MGRVDFNDLWYQAPAVSRPDWAAMGRRLTIQIAITKPGRAMNVDRMKKVTQSVWSANQPLEADSQVRPTAMKEENSAYCVPV